jgi:regulator of replication initiation timing
MNEFVGNMNSGCGYQQPKNLGRNVNREQLIKGNLKMVYEQLGELLRENRDLRNENELMKMKICNLEVEVKNKAAETDNLLQQIQKRVTCSNEDLPSKLADIGLMVMGKTSQSSEMN